jgi:protein TonB
MSNLGIFLRRYFVAFGFAAVTTGALLILMEQLIRPDFAEVVAQPPPTKIDFDRSIKEPPLIIKETILEPPPPVLPPPLVALVPTVDSANTTWSVGPIDPGPIKTEINPGLSRSDGGLLIIAQVAANYPERARRNNLQGYVVVEFTVDVTGAVRNVQVIESQPKGVFDQAAVVSVERSKYRPRVEGGTALVVHGVRKRGTFTLQI